MAAPTLQQLALRAEVEAAARAEFAASGRVSKSALVARFADRGAGRTALFNWLSEAIPAEEVIRSEMQRHGSTAPAALDPVSAPAADPAPAPAPPATRPPPAQQYIPEDVFAGMATLIGHMRQAVTFTLAKDGSIRNFRGFIQANTGTANMLKTLHAMQLSRDMPGETGRFLRELVAIVGESIERPEDRQRVKEAIAAFIARRGGFPAP